MNSFLNPAVGAWEETVNNPTHAAPSPDPNPSRLLEVYRTLVLRRLGREQEAALEEMRMHARRQMETEPRIDYFATSPPNFLLFDGGLAVRNAPASLLLPAFAELGLGNAANARAFPTGSRKRRCRVRGLV